MIPTKKKLTIEVIKAETAIETEIKAILDTCPTSDLRPLPLTQWAKKLFIKARELGHKDEEIAEWVKVYAKKGNWSMPQISTVLRENGYQRYKTAVSTGNLQTKFRPKHYIASFKRIVQELSGLDELDVLRIESPTRLAEISEDNLTQFVSRMGETELREYPRQMANLKALFTRMEDLIEHKKKVAKFGEITR